MDTLAERFFGSDEIAEERRTLRIRLSPISQATDRYDEGFGVMISSDEPMRVPTLLTGYEKQIINLLEKFGFVAIENPLPNNIPPLGSTPTRNCLMHTDEYEQQSGRHTWFFTQLSLPQDPQLEERVDPTHVADTGTFAPHLLASLETHLMAPHAEFQADLQSLLGEMKVVDDPAKQLMLFNSKGKPDEAIFSTCVAISRHAFYASEKGRYAFQYRPHGDIERHLILGASGLNFARNCCHSRLDTPEGGSLDSTVYPLAPRDDVEGADVRDNLLARYELLAI